MQHHDSPALARAQEDDASLKAAKFQANYHAWRIIHTIHIVRGGLFRVDADRIRGCLTARFLKHPLRALPKRQVALHEAGHFIAYEVEGMYAWIKDAEGRIQKIGWIEAGMALKLAYGDEVGFDLWSTIHRDETARKDAPVQWASFAGGGRCPDK